MYDVRNLKLWAYARSSSPRPEVLIRQMKGLLTDAEQNGWQIVGTQCDVSYVLYIKGLSQALHQRAVRKGLGLPWWTGGERYTEINRAAGND